MTQPEDQSSVVIRADEIHDLSPRGPAPIQITPQYIETTKQSLALLQGMVKDVLVEGRDYGSVPGIPGKFLFDPGASQIVGAFNCFPGHRRMISLVDDGEKIAVVIEVPLIQRGTGLEVGSGIGAASTLEVRHKYRWVTNPREWGFEGDSVKALKSRQKDGGQTEYRIPNPEHDELLNTITKQASKRAEVDAAEALPGVASVLREMFSPGKRGKPGAAAGGDIDETSPRWTKFWAAIRPMLPDGADYQAETHRLLKVASMKDWLKRGKSLDDAIKEIAALTRKTAATERRNPRTVSPAELDGPESLERIMKQCFGWDPRKVWSEANYTGADNFEEDGTETAWQLFQRLIELARTFEGSPEDSH